MYDHKVTPVLQFFGSFLWMLSQQIAFSVRLSSKFCAGQPDLSFVTMVKDKKEKIISPHGPVVAQIDNTPEKEKVEIGIVILFGQVVVLFCLTVPSVRSAVKTGQP